MRNRLMKWKINLIWKKIYIFKITKMKNKDIKKSSRRIYNYKRKNLKNNTANKIFLIKILNL